MKKLILILIVSSAFSLKAQNYTFSKSTGAYTNLSGSTILDNSNWSAIEKGIKLPFTFSYWGIDFSDSIYIDDYGSISFDDSYSEEINFLNDDLDARGAGKSPVSYQVSGTTPNRILKIEYRNAGFSLNLSHTDSANVQCWIYETSNIIEFRYGPNGVTPSSWSDNGAFVGIISDSLMKFIILEANPANPTINKTNIGNAATLNGMPADGTIYKFTPGNGSGLAKTIVGINVIQDKIVLSSNVDVKGIKIYNTSGQLLQSALIPGDIDISKLNHGLYIVVVELSEGAIAQKLVY